MSARETAPSARLLYGISGSYTALLLAMMLVMGSKEMNCPKSCILEYAWVLLAQGDFLSYSIASMAGNTALALLLIGGVASRSGTLTGAAAVAIHLPHLWRFFHGAGIHIVLLAFIINSVALGTFVRAQARKQGAAVS